jgi:hypothetical protein
VELVPIRRHPILHSRRCYADFGGEVSSSVPLYQIFTRRILLAISKAALASC